MERLKDIAMWTVLGLGKVIGFFHKYLFPIFFGLWLIVLCLKEPAVFLGILAGLVLVGGAAIIAAWADERAANRRRAAARKHWSNEP